MAGFYLTPAALCYLAEFILALGITLYLVSRPHKSRSTWLFLGFFACVTGYATASFVWATSAWATSFYAVHFQVLFLALALVPLLQFAYHFHASAPAPRAARVALGVSLLAVALSLAWALYQFGQFTPSGRPTTATVPSDMWLAVGFLWVILVFWRRTWSLSRADGPERPWWQHLLRPHGRAARATAAFALVFMLAAGLSGVLALGEFIPALAKVTRQILPTSGVLINLFLIAIVYFNHATEPTSFRVKLVGIALVTVLLIIGLAGALVVPATTEARATPPLAARTLRFEPTPTGGYTLTTLPPRFDPDQGAGRGQGYHPLPFSVRLFGRQWDEVHLSRQAYLSFGPHDNSARQFNLRPMLYVLDIPSRDPSQIYVKESAERYTVTWVLPTAAAGVPDMVVQAVIEASGAFELRYPEGVQRPFQRLGVLTGNGGLPALTLDLSGTYSHSLIPDAGLLADFMLPVRVATHRTLLPLAYLSVAATLLIFLGFPLFFQAFLVRPLNALVGGVRAVNAGDLTVQVPVQFPDEIGLVTESFNHMVASVREADERLEEQVAQRTQELASSEERFRALATSSLEALLIHDRGLILDANEAAQALFGYPHAALVGKSLYDLLDPASHSLVARQLAHRAPEPYEVRGLAQDGTPLPLEVRTREVPYGSRRAQVMVARNLADRKELERQTQQVAALEERARIGRELHDDLGQVMGFVSVQSQAALALLDAAQVEQVRAALTQLASVAQAAHADVRQYILGIRLPAAQRESAFFPTLDAALRALREQYGMELQVSLPDSLPPSPLAPEVEGQLLRIIQEGLTNVRKHATRPAARLFLTLTPDEMQVVIADDGPGFDPAQHGAEARAHFGLAIMRERAEQVRGSLEVRSQPGAGTSLIVRVPRVLSGVGDFPAGVRVLLADDHQLYREGLRTLLTARGLRVVGQAQDGEEAVAQARALRPDLILMDIHMPRCDGLEATRRIMAEVPESKIVMLTVAAEGETLFEALRAGAAGYLLKSLEEGEFYRLLGEVLAGETALSADLAARLLGEAAQEAKTPAHPDLLPLTTRQLEVLEQLAAGKGNKAIAQALHVSENTVKFHIKELLTRLQMSSRHQLGQFAQQRGMGPPDGAE